MVQTLSLSPQACYVIASSTIPDDRAQPPWAVNNRLTIPSGILFLCTFWKRIDAVFPHPRFYPHVLGTRQALALALALAFGFASLPVSTSLVSWWRGIEYGYSYIASTP